MKIKRIISMLLSAICVLALFSACAELPELPKPDDPKYSKAETAPSIPEAVTLPAPTSEPAPEPTSTPEPLPTPTPEPSPEILLTEDYFNDAIFFGGSVMGTLQYHAHNFGGMGKALFFCDYTYSMHKLTSPDFYVIYNDARYSVPEIIKQTISKKAFFMLGTDDVYSIGIDETMDYWDELLGSVQEVSPLVRIFIISLTPVYDCDSKKLTNELVESYNARLKKYCKDNGYTYVDICDYFKDENGTLRKDLCRDKYLNLRIDAGAFWAELMLDPKNYSVSPNVFSAS